MRVMMEVRTVRVQVTEHQVSVWLSAEDTECWANRLDDNGCWPCSELSDRRLFAAFDCGGIVELEIGGGRGEQDVDAYELYACLSDYLRGHKELPEDHWVWDYLTWSW